ncbi:Uncharacterised protein [Streptococcus pneumoniae]|nr:Uncharacterised protein [Streptococcus pneumoniae]
MLFRPTPPVTITETCGIGALTAEIYAGLRVLPGKSLMISLPASSAVVISVRVIQPGMYGVL